MVDAAVNFNFLISIMIIYIIIVHYLIFTPQVLRNAESKHRIAKID